MVYGLSAALRGNITIDRGRVAETNFHQYEPLRMNEMPEVEVHIVPSTAAPGGMGELTTPAIAPAVGNAIFAATGKRIRRLPFSLENAWSDVHETTKVIEVTRRVHRCSIFVIFVFLVRFVAKTSATLRF